jgi:hypothetical protein
MLYIPHWYSLLELLCELGWLGSIARDQLYLFDYSEYHY